MTDTQPSRLLPALFDNVDEESRLTVLNLGPILPETVDFFSAYRCKLHIANLYSELPLPGISDEDQDSTALRECLEQALFLPAGVRFDIVFFWDIINFLSLEAIALLMELLHPCLHAGTKAHGFAVHNSQTPAAMEYYGIFDQENFKVRPRTQVPPGYMPRSQGDLGQLLRYFVVDRSVLMRDRRVELLLKSRL